MRSRTDTEDGRTCVLSGSLTSTTRLEESRWDLRLNVLIREDEARVKYLAQGHKVKRTQVTGPECDVLTTRPQCLSNI